MKNKNLVFFDENWSQLFEKEHNLLKSVLKNNFVESYHIGSTSIKGIFSKPKIDIALIVNDLEKSKIIEEIGYDYRGCFNIPFRYFFSKRDDNLKINLHVIEPNNPELDGFLIFRNFLNENEKLRNEYSELKLKFEKLIDLKKNENFFNEYTLAKNEFIGKVLKIAGFKGFCIRFVAHYSEKDYEKSVYTKFKDDDIRFIFYKGSDIIGYANADKITKHINFFQVKENEDYFRCKINNYLKGASYD